VDHAEVYEALRAAIEDLAEANLGAPVIVEGERDVRSLRQLGITGEVLSLNSGISIFNLAESIARRHTDAIILTDWDHRGGMLCRLLRDAFEANQVRYDVDLRARITLLCRKDIKDVESLAAHVERLARQVAGGWHGKESKKFYAQRKSRAGQDRRARRILATRSKSRGP
jgi:5S rRNA maturation endonuclease (ribonuclease M5)